ncbi:MAG: 50S ribosomal protein L13 [Bacteroidia bacterium]|nr:50S ribosomal protein L13 [Bacteroidia bacterium]
MYANSYKTISSNIATSDKKWLVVDVQGMVLGRAASQIAMLLRGKHKPLYSPHADCGDNVIVLNADKIRLTGTKWDNKEYIRHTSYPGGQRVMTAKEMMAKHPTRMVEKAVRGMLPKNRLGRKLFSNMRVYVGDTHPHDAQSPETYELKS